jgi:hypothetical protein
MADHIPFALDAGVIHHRTPPDIRGLHMTVTTGTLELLPAAIRALIEIEKSADR